MYVIDVLAESVVVEVGDIGKVFVLAACRNAHVAVLGRFFRGFFGKVARYEIIGFPFFEKIEGNGLELSGRAALNEKYVVIIGNVEKFAEKRDAFVVNGFVNFAAVRRFGYAYAAAFEIDEFLLCFK